MIKISTLMLLMIFILGIPNFTIAIIGQNIPVLKVQTPVQHTSSQSRTLKSLTPIASQPSSNYELVIFTMIVVLVGMLINFVINIIVRLIQELSKWLQTLLILFVILVLLGIYFEPIRLGKMINVVVDLINSCLDIIYFF